MQQAIETELARTKADTAGNQETRRALQGSRTGEVDILGDTQRKGVGRVLEVGIEHERLKHEILAARRGGAICKSPVNKGCIGQCSLSSWTTESTAAACKSLMARMLTEVSTSP